jgi:hypothetical protein
VTLEEFKATPSEQWSGALLALWWDGQGNWDHAHEVAQEIEDRDGAWVHAYLHRKEGDEANAGYWYRRAGRRPASGDLSQEWRQIVEEMLAR